MLMFIVNRQGHLVQASIEYKYFVEFVLFFKFNKYKEYTILVFSVDYDDDADATRTTGGTFSMAYSVLFVQIVWRVDLRDQSIAYWDCGIYFMLSETYWILRRNNCANLVIYALIPK